MTSPGNGANSQGLYAQYTLYSSNLQQKAQFSQINFGTVTTNSLNGASYQIGDILRLQAASNIYIANNPGWQGSSQNTSTGGSPIVGSSSNGTDVYYEITSAGVVPLNGVRGQYYFENGKIQYSVQNQNTLVLNSWGNHGVLSLAFNGSSINASGIYKWLGQNVNQSLQMQFYSSDGSQYKNYYWYGTDEGNEVASQINGMQYQNNSTLLISSNFPQTNLSGTVLNERGNDNQINNLNVTRQYGYQLTSNGLVPLNGSKDLNGVTYRFENGLAVSSAQKSDLSNEINTAKAINTTGYTPDSVTALQNAINAANSVMNNSNASPEDILGATANLQNAVKGLMPNKAGLESAISQAKAMDMSGYTPDSVTALQNAIKTAEGVASNSNATAKEVSDAMTGLQNAVKGLMPNKAGLETAIAQAKAMDMSGYTPESATALQNAIKMAEGVVANKDATAKDVSDAMMTLQNAVKGLMPNKAGLETAIAQAKAMDMSGYTPESATALQNAIKMAEGVVANKDATAKDVSDAMMTLQNAIKGLMANKAGLESAIAQAKAMDMSGYTPESATALQNAIKMAEGVVANKDATAKDVSEAMMNLQNAVKGLMPNKAGLETAIAQAKAMDMNGYTPESATALQNAIKMAEGVVANKDATAKDVSDAMMNLQNAVKGLMPVGINSNDVKDVYWDGDALVINGELNGANMSSNVVKTLEITNEYGESVTLTGANVNWYSGNADNYNGYQFVIRQSLLRNLVGENYTLKVNVTVGNKQYSMPITAAGYTLPNKMESGFNPMITGKDLTLQNVKTNSSKVELSTEVNMAKVLLQNPSYTTSQKDMLSKVLGEVEPVLSNTNATTQEIGQAVSKLESAMSSLVKMNTPNNAEIVYWDESSDQDSLVINGALSGLNIPSNVQKELVITNGTKTSTVMGATVNWYSGSADNYNGYQFILGSKQLKGLNEGIYSMYVKFTLNGKVYEVPISIDKALPLVVKNDFMPINSEGSLQLVTGSVRIKLLEDIQSLKASDIGNEPSVLNVINQAEVIAKSSTATQAQLKNADQKIQDISK